MNGRAICVRCAAEREDWRAICPSCGHRAVGEGLLVAWLLSDQNLDAAGLAEAAGRIRSGQGVRPSQRMLDRARGALGASFSSDPGLGWRGILGLAALGLVATPLPGLVLWAWWLRTRPRSAWQALVASVPGVAFGFAVGIGLILY
jgi:hypothetical protein